MHRFLRAILTVLVCALVSLPAEADAGLVGGRANVVIPCIFNASIWTQVSGPDGGLFIWTPFTKTYPNGPPAPGKYILGLSGIPYFCLVWIAPLFPIPGIAITMMGSSGGGGALVAPPAGNIQAYNSLFPSAVQFAPAATTQAGGVSASSTEATSSPIN